MKLKPKEITASLCAQARICVKHKVNPKRYGGPGYLPDAEALLSLFMADFTKTVQATSVTFAENESMRVAIDRNEYGVALAVNIHARVSSRRSGCYKKYCLGRGK